MGGSLRYRKREARHHPECAHDRNIFDRHTDPHRGGGVIGLRGLRRPYNWIAALGILFAVMAAIPIFATFV
ncbi:MAG TPA: hypothetical protein VF503_07255 [Sphingobium sp.]|uniref:hypothetical protein n=1 Tax=Sphingobium sp. TaxID=1912891 RepID=UPI002ED0CE95